MNSQARNCPLRITNLKSNRISRMFVLVLWLLLPVFSTGLLAQDQPQGAEEIPASGLQTPDETGNPTILLPDSQAVALALSQSDSREDVLLDLAAAASVLTRAEDAPGIKQAELAQDFLDNREWLNMLVEHYGWVQPASPVLDPAAWQVLGKLHQYGIKGMALVIPGRAPDEVLQYQVFHRPAQRLAAANLPNLLLGVETAAIEDWDAFLRLTGPAESRDAGWKTVADKWLSRWWTQETEGSGVDTPERFVVVEDIPWAMSGLVSSAVGTGPPDPWALVRLRLSIHDEISRLLRTGNDPARYQAADALYLVNLIDGLNEDRYFEFLRGLLAVTSSLTEQGSETAESLWLVDWLVRELPGISAHFAADFAQADPHLNAVMVIVFNALKDIAAVREGDSENHEMVVRAIRTKLADAVAQLTLLIPDMGYYFDIPVRARIDEEVDSCISAASPDENGNSGMTRTKFDDCMQNMLQLADGDARLAELSGDMDGPFTDVTLRRELNLTPWQRINFGIGYLHEHYPTSCKPPADPLPNPLEWAVLATTMTWLAEQFPDFIHTPENEALLTSMRGIGEQLMLTMAQQASCLAGQGTPIDDPVNRGITDYELALRDLNKGIDNAEADFRSQRLRPGADVSLEGDALQKTAYRPDDIVINPCDAAAVCEMSGSLSTTRALIGLFPQQYLLAEQTGMGHIEICYRNMEWVQRRSELVRADDKNVANYFGRLGFDLVGRYEEKGQVSNIFGFRFTSPDEYHYLFAQASEDILNDSCPVEWVGSRLVTPLREERGGIVPDRLTYLAASRKLPSRLLQNNWDRGAEWRDWFVTGIGVSKLKVPPPEDITARLDQHLQSLYQGEQAEIYQRVLLPSIRNPEGKDVSLFAEMSQVSITKALLRLQMMLFYPESLFDSERIRMAVAGDGGLLDGRILRRYHESNVALTSVHGIARQRLDQLIDAWSSQPQTVRREGSIPISLMHALTRINYIYRQFFTPRPEPLQEIDTAAQAEEQEPVQKDQP